MWQLILCTLASAWSGYFMFVLAYLLKTNVKNTFKHKITICSTDQTSYQDKWHDLFFAESTSFSRWHFFPVCAHWHFAAECIKIQLVYNAKITIWKKYPTPYQELCQLFSSFYLHECRQLLRYSYICTNLPFELQNNHSISSWVYF